MFFSCFSFSILLLNSLCFHLHIFGLYVLFSVLVGMSFCTSFFPPFLYLLLITFANFPSCFQYLQENFSLFLLLCSPLCSFLLFDCFDFFVRPPNLSLSIPQIYQINLLLAHSGTHSKALHLWVHEKCSVSRR